MPHICAPISHDRADKDIFYVVTHLYVVHGHREMTPLLQCLPCMHEKLVLFREVT